VNVLLAVGGGRLDMLGGGWDGWPLVGAVVALWIGRRILQVSWGVGLLIGVLATALALPTMVHAWGIVPTAGLILALTIVLWIGRGRGSANRNSAV
jgi:hypothetical protein